MSFIWQRGLKLPSYKSTKNTKRTAKLKIKGKIWFKEFELDDQALKEITRLEKAQRPRSWGVRLPVSISPSLYLQTLLNDFILLFDWLLNCIVSHSAPLSQSSRSFLQQKKIPFGGGGYGGVCAKGGEQRLNWASHHDKSLVNEESIVSSRIVSPLLSFSPSSFSSLCPLDRYLGVVKLTQIMNWPLWTVLTILTGCTQQMSPWQKATGKSTLG